MKYQCIFCLGVADWQQSTEEVLVNYKVIPNLSRGTYYEVRVVAFDGYYREFSEIKVVGTVGFGKIHYEI